LKNQIDIFFEKREGCVTQLGTAIHNLFDSTSIFLHVWLITIVIIVIIVPARVLRRRRRMPYTRVANWAFSRMLAVLLVSQKKVSKLLSCNDLIFFFFL
jgi:hypothetical protein